MTKKEIIWRHILNEAFTKRHYSFTQKDVAQLFHLSTSTVFNALKAPRKLGAIAVTGRNFQLKNAEKLLLLWATVRNLKKEIIYQTRVDMPILKIEGTVPGSAIFAAMSAYRLKYNQAQADYSTVYIYCADLENIKKRFPQKKGVANLVVLKPDSHLASFGHTTPDVQTFADLWNLSEWYAADFLDALKKRLKI